MITKEEFLIKLEQYEDGDIKRKVFTQLLRDFFYAKPTEKESLKHIPGRFNPEKDAGYWAARDVKAEKHNYYQDTTNSERMSGGCCETEEEVKFIRRQQEAYLEFLGTVFELNGIWEADFEDKHQKKGYFLFNHEAKVLSILNVEIIQEQPIWHYFNPKVGEKIIERLTEGKIKLALFDSFDKLK